MISSKNTPTVLIVFGATGDLMAKKVAPALYHLYTKNALPRMLHIVGFSRRNLTDAEFKNHIQNAVSLHIPKTAPKKQLSAFLNLISYEQGRFDNPIDYQNLAVRLGRVDNEWKTCANKLFYLAVPPRYYETIFQNLDKAGLTIPCGPDGGWTRILVEKPFGNDLETAQRLDAMLGKLFEEEQIYRIDHYLAKEMLQNILTFRFSNNILESSWNNRHIESIKIRFHEQGGVEGRGEFYDKVGALRDVGQNHMLQMLALVTMDHPRTLSAEHIRTERARLLAELRTLSKQDIATSTVRGQFRNYHTLAGVAKKSQTETYFRIEASIDSPRWAGVPIILEQGKYMPRTQKDIEVTFRHTSPCLCPPGGAHYKNVVRFSFEPDAAITINFLSKKAGLDNALEEQYFTNQTGNKNKDRWPVASYEKLLLDCIEGNQLLFVSTKEVEAMWRFVDPIICAWNAGTVPLFTYTPDTIFQQKKLPLKPDVQSIVTDHKTVGVVGLGKMGSGIATQLLEKGWNVVGYNRTFEKTQEFVDLGMKPAHTLEKLVAKLPKPRVVWVMVPAGAAVEETLVGKDGLVNYLSKGDIVIDAGNSRFTESVRRSALFQKKGIRFIDAGVSGGPSGARYGACMMIGGDEKTYRYLEPLFAELSVAFGQRFFAGAGAGHFVKMVHNGIEYGMMQAIAEGFAVMKKSPYKLPLSNIADVYNHGSVIESRLIAWLKEGFELFGENLSVISGSVAHTGEGAWTVEAAKELGVHTPIIEESLEYRKKTEKKPDYTGKLLSTMRNRFGGHSIEGAKEKKK